MAGRVARRYSGKPTALARAKELMALRFEEYMAARALVKKLQGKGKDNGKTIDA